METIKINVSLKDAKELFKIKFKKWIPTIVVEETQAELSPSEKEGIQNFFLLWFENAYEMFKDNENFFESIELFLKYETSFYRKEELISFYELQESDFYLLKKAYDKKSLNNREEAIIKRIINAVGHDEIEFARGDYVIFL